MEKNGSPFRKFGKTALILGGGGSRGAYEIGVWQALREMEIPIHIAAGTSVGAINGAAVAQGSFDRACRLWRQLTTTEVFDFSQAVKNGGASYTSLKKTLNENQIKCVMHDLLFALQALHAKYKIVHRDIKAGNILLSTPAN